MAKITDKELINKVLDKPSDEDFIGRMLSAQDEDFPSVSDITLDEPYVDPFAIPKWLNQATYAYAWIDLGDDIQRYRALDVGYFKIVNRSSSCIIGKYSERDFRDHGAVERQGMILVYRPKDLDDKLRTRSVYLHGEITSSMAEGKKEDGWELTHSKSKTDTGSNIDVVAYEEAGEIGIKQVG
jgi:hypothetical protein